MSKEKPSPEHTQDGDNSQTQEEKGGFKDQGLPEPTRYGDWEVGGRCSDF